MVGDARAVALIGFEPKLSQGERRLKNELAEVLRKAGFSPPDATELASFSAGRSAAVPELLSLLGDEERVVELTPLLYLDFEVAAELRRRVTARLADGSTLTMSELRDLLGTTRKYAVPIGEYLDRIGLTIREGDIRRLANSVNTPSASRTE
ncbi:MAG: hypothetical protein NVSMB9_10670 [Isosphaeraceae bacterium]